MKERGVSIIKEIFYYSFIIVLMIRCLKRDYNFMFIICNEHGNGVGRKSMIWLGIKHVWSLYIVVIFIKVKRKWSDHSA